jgi:hypothetical protein
MLTMARKKAAAAPKVASKVLTELVSGPYPLDNFRAVMAILVKMESSVKLTIPYSWAKTNCPIFSPNALRLIELIIGTDKELGSNFHLDFGRGRKK